MRIHGNRYRNSSRGIPGDTRAAGSLYLTAHTEKFIPPGRAYIERQTQFMEKVRIQKIIADSGRCSRRKAEELISAGLVTVNGRPCTLGDKADPVNDLIRVEGDEISAERAEKRYIMLNKPRGYVTSMADEMGRKVGVRPADGRAGARLPCRQT